MRLYGYPLLVIVAGLVLTRPAPTRTSAAAAVAADVVRFDGLVSEKVQGNKKAHTGFAWDEHRPRAGTGRSLFAQSIVGGTLTKGQEFPFFVEGNVRCLAARRVRREIHSSF